MDLTYRKHWDGYVKGKLQKQQHQGEVIVPATKINFPSSLSLPPKKSSLLFHMFNFSSLAGIDTQFVAFLCQNLFYFLSAGIMF